MILRRYKYTAAKGVQKIKTRTAKVLMATSAGVASVVTSAALLLAPAGAAPTTVYDNIPSPQPGNLSSQAFEATQTAEFGGQVSFAGTARSNPTVTVLMSSWGCESGSWNAGDCATTPGSTFSEPITLNVYNVGASNSVGSLVTTSTQTFNIPYRPSASPTCGDGRWSDGTTCYNGFATPISFTLTGVTLPDNAVVSVAYNTTHYGYAPIGESAACFTENGGCGYDSLNVGLNGTPTTGSDPQPDNVYTYATGSYGYCDGAGDNGSTSVFRETAACWTGFQPAFKVDVAAPQVLGSATGGLTLSTPRQQISFNAFDTGVNSSSDYGTVEYQNFEYPGGLHYTANVLCATVSGNTARFMFQIPAGYPGLSGLYVVASVTDGGSPGKGHDVYGHTATGSLATAQAWCENGAPVGNYTVTGGNAVVHKQ